MFNRTLQILSFLFTLLLVSCNDSGKGPTNTEKDKLSQKINGFGRNATFDPNIKYVGLWPHINPYSDQITQWKLCVNANATIIPDGYQWPDGIRNSLNTAINNGYALKLWRVEAPINGNSAVLAILNDPTIGPNLTGLFIDEPFQHNWTDGQVLEVVGQCQSHGWLLGVANFSLTDLEHLRSLVAQNYPAMYNNIIYMPDKYFDVAWDEQIAFYNDVKYWALSSNISLTKIMPWVSPSCSFPGWLPAQGCGPQWTYDIICYHKQLGFGGIFIYPGNGIGASTSDEMKAALSECGWSQVNFGCGYPLTY